MTSETNSANIRIWPPAAFLIAIAIGFVIDKISWWHVGIPLGHWLERRLGWVAVVAGLAIMMTALGLFKKAGTSPEPWKQVSALVTDGVYRWTRNPMYLGMALMQIGVALLYDSLVTLLLIIPVIFWITRNVIEKEEAFMAARFGAEYDAYRTKVGRWF